MISNRGVVLRFASTAGEAAARATEDPGNASDPRPSACWLVLDPAWTPPPGDGEGVPIPLRAVAGRALGREDLFPTTTQLLDDWAEASGVVDALAVDGTSFWYRRRLWAWRWLHERLIWIGILDDIARQRTLVAIELPGPDEPALGDVVRLIARRDGLAILPGPAGVDAGGDATATWSEGSISPGARGPGIADDVADPPPDRPPTAARSVGAAPGRGGPLGGFLRDLVHRTRFRASDRRRARITARRAAADGRVEALAAEGGGRLLAIVDPAALQPVATATGVRSVDPFLGPVLGRLAGTALDPIIVELGSRAADDATWARLTTTGGERTLCGDTVERRFAGATDDHDSADIADGVRIALGRCDAGLVHAGVDLAPDLRAGLERFVRDGLPARLREVARAKRLLAALRPAALLMVDEYGRTEWSLAARRLGVPVAAVQHGIIHPWHPGYQHRTRPASRPVPERTYLFGDYERRLLVALGGYRPDEVVVSGSPRLDLVPREVPPGDLARLRTELGCAPGERMLVITTTFASVYRRFYTPVALAALLDPPPPGVRIVIKLHPGEADGGLYRHLLAGLARAGGREAPDPAIVKRVDLYRLLAAADAHLGLYSTVLTEAVVTGTPNLLAATQASTDLLGYVAAGVAVPVSTSARLRAVLEAPLIVDGPARQAFLDDHFRPGAAAEWIATDLGAWLAGRG